MDSNEDSEREINKVESPSRVCYVPSNFDTFEAPPGVVKDFMKTSEVINKISENMGNAIERPTERSQVTTRDDNTVGAARPVCSPGHSSIKSLEGMCEKLTDNYSESHVGSVSETFSNNVTHNVTESDKNEAPSHAVKKFILPPEPFTDSSQSFSSELQLPTIPFESSCSSQGNNFNAVRTNFEHAIESQAMWSKPQDLSAIEKKETVAIPTDLSEKVPAPDTPVQGTELPPVSELVPTSKVEMPSFGFPPPSSGTQDQPVTNESRDEIKVEQQPPPEPPPVPIIPPAPRKRGRPRKQVLPNPSPLVESWGPNAQEFPTLEVKKEEKRPSRPERRQTKRRRYDEEEKEKPNGDAETPKRRFVVKPPVKKTKRRSTYTPKKKLPPPKKKRSEMENIQNFEEETRMSASEGGAGFSSRSGIGEESQGSSVTTEGHTRSNINKKGRMEVMTDGCKPVTVQQIVEYFWPPPSSLPHGEKPEGLMIQEQISEYLGVKSFKRKYPSIKRRPVDMEERNYLQENGYVSENMCDMGLTAVFSADIIEIMYNDFPQKFEEYRKYTREKKAKEQRALREKQAAERADMDPKKEAVESAFSWNNEFNKTRRFKVLHVRPEMRFLTDGTPCRPFERVVINHAPNNSALCIENEYWKMSLFTYECEVSANTKLNERKAYTSPNLWMMMVDSGN